MNAKNNDLVSAAKGAIADVFGDASVGHATTLINLAQLREQIDDYSADVQKAKLFDGPDDPEDEKDDDL